MSEPTVERTPATTHSPERAVVTAHLPESGEVEIDIYGPERILGEDRPARVNWPGIGAVSGKDAVAFAEALVAAAVVSESLTAPTGVSA